MKQKIINIFFMSSQYVVLVTTKYMREIFLLRLCCSEAVSSKLPLHQHSLLIIIINACGKPVVFLILGRATRAVCSEHALFWCSHAETLVTVNTILNGKLGT